MMIHRSQVNMQLIALGVLASVANIGGLIAQSSGENDPQSYLAHLAAANSALRLNETAEARRWLDEIPQEARRWEWQLLNARADSSIRKHELDSGTPIRVDLSLDGRKLAVAGSDGFVRIFLAKNLQLETEFKVSDQVAYSARFHPQGKLIAVCSRDGQLSLWDIGTATKVWAHKSGGEGLADIAFRPDGQQLLYCGWYRSSQSVLGIVSTWDSVTGKQTWKTEFGVKPIVAARYSLDGKYFAVGTWDAQVGVWSCDVLGEPRVFDFADLTQYSAVDDIAFSPNSSQIAAASKNGTPRIWNIDGTTPPIDFAGHTNAVFSIAFSPDGKSLLTGGSDGVLAIWDISRRLQTHRFYGHTNRVVSIAIDSQTHTVTTASADRSLRQWDTSLSRPFEASESSKLAYGLVVADQGKLLITGGQSPTTISVWESGTKKSVRHFSGTQGTINFLDGDGGELVAGGNWNGDVAIWNVHTGEVVRQMGSKELGGLQQCSLSDDQRWLVASTNKKQLVVWNAKNGEVTKIIPMPNGCWGVDFSEDGETLAVGDGQGTVHWISTNNWETEWKCQAGLTQINALRIAKSGKWLAAGSESGLLTIVDTENGNVNHQIQGHSERIWTLDISPDEQRIVTGSADRRVKTWDPIKGVSLLTISDFAESIYNIRFSLDGRTLFVNSLGSQIVSLSID